MSAKNNLLVVACALMDERGQVLLAQRPAHKMLPGKWEFPGGKVEIGETPQAALARELQEELAIHTRVENFETLTFLTHDYPEFFLVLLVYVCRQWEGVPTAQEHPQLQWVHPDAMHDIDMIEADVAIVDSLKIYLEKHRFD